MIILISGKQGSGKTTLSDGLRELFGKNMHKVDVIKFADPFYHLHNVLWDYMGKYGYKLNKAKDGELLQYLGTDWARKTIDNDIWANICFKRAVECIENNKALPTFNNKDGIVLIDDLRFKNELDVFGKYDVDTPIVSIRLECDEDVRKERCSYWRENTNHPSEVDLDDCVNKFNIIINTNLLDAQSTLMTVYEALLLRMKND